MAAKTHQIRAVGVAIQSHPALSYAAQWEPEGASQTFAAGTPVVWSSGLLVASTSAIETDAGNKVTGLALEAGNNAAAATTNLCKFLPAVDGIVFSANLLTGDGADNVLAAADLGQGATQALRAKSGLITTSVTDWFLDDADTNGTQIVSFRPDIILPNLDVTRAEAGDTNARVGFVFVTGVRTYPDA